VDALIADLRQTLRALARRPGFVATAVATLALAIGGTTAIFALFEAVLLRPLPWPESDRLVSVFEARPERPGRQNVANPGNFLAWRERSKTLEDAAAWVRLNANLGLEGEAAQVRAGLVTGNFFSVLRAPAALGRTLQMADSVPDAPGVVVLSHHFWRARFGGDPGVVGRTVRFDGEAAEIVGVMPPGHEFPTRADLWAPITILETWRTSRGRSLNVVGRLRAGATVPEGDAEMQTIAAGLAAERPEFNARWTAGMAPLHETLVAQVRPALVVLLGAVCFVLLVACANVANLLLARAVGRQREIAVRAALGGSRWRLARLIVVEALMIAAAGAALGLVVARWAVAGLLAIVPAEIPSFMDVRISGAVVAFAAACALAAALLSALVPARQAGRADIVPSLREGSPGGGMGRERRRLGRWFVTGEVALACTLLVGTALFARSLDRLLSVDAGFDPARVFTFHVRLGGPAYTDPASFTRFFSALVERVKEVPGVRSASAITWLPLGLGSATRFSLPDREAPPPGQSPTGDVRMVTPGMFDTLGVPLLEGRDFTRDDTAGRPMVVIVNRTLAAKYWPGQSALGKRIAMSWGEDRLGEVVGVVGDVRWSSLEEKARETMYWPAAQLPNGFMNVLVKSDRPPDSLAPDMAAVLKSMDPGLAFADPQPLESVVSGSVQRPMFTLALTGAFSALAVVLCAIGLFGTLSYFVGERPADLVRLVVGEAMGLAALGAAAGLLAAAALAGAVRAQLFETSPVDPVAHAAAAAVVAVIALAAASLPALRASRTDATHALRAE
jgi:putative ABC transport system permease protein